MAGWTPGEAWWSSLGQGSLLFPNGDLTDVQCNWTLNSTLSPLVTLKNQAFPGPLKEMYIPSVCGNPVGTLFLPEILSGVALSPAPHGCLQPSALRGLGLTKFPENSPYSWQEVKEEWNSTAHRGNGLQH